MAALEPLEETQAGEETTALFLGLGFCVGLYLGERVRKLLRLGLRLGERFR